MSTLNHRWIQNLKSTKKKMKVITRKQTETMPTWDLAHNTRQQETEGLEFSTKDTIYTIADQHLQKTLFSHPMHKKPMLRCRIMSYSSWESLLHLYIMNSNDFNICSICSLNLLILWIIKENHFTILNLCIKPLSFSKLLKTSWNQWHKKLTNHWFLPNKMHLFVKN